MPSGLVLIDKPSGWTSHDVVARLRKVLGTKKVGHAGTLDPMATGLLVLGVDSATKLLTFIVGADKTYLATIRLGQSTITDDAEGEISSTAKAEQILKVSEKLILTEIEKLTGVVEQVPSSVSAIKVDGVRSYTRVREGEAVTLASRQVTIARFEVVGPVRFGQEFIDIDVIVDCSSGTYIRALARDLGSALEVGGHLTALRRTRVGGYSIEQANQLPEIGEAVDVIDSFEASKAFEQLELSDSDVIDLRHGKRLKAKRKFESVVAGVNNSKLIAMLEQSGSQLKSLVVFND